MIIMAKTEVKDSGKRKVKLVRLVCDDERSLLNTFLSSSV